MLAALDNPDSLANLPEIPFEMADFEMLMSLGFGKEDFEGDFDEAGAEASLEAMQSCPTNISRALLHFVSHRQGILP